MIVCPNCNHQNPDGANQCEACFTPLPTTTSCPNCGTGVQSDAAFCGQCGYNLKTSSGGSSEGTAPASQSSGLPATVVSSQPGVEPIAPLPMTSTPEVESPNVMPPPIAPIPEIESPNVATPAPMMEFELPESVAPVAPISSPPPMPSSNSATQLQQPKGKLFHIQTNTLIELPQNLSVIHIGKPNDQIPPDIDVSGFPNSEVVSRIHADIRAEGDAYYLEDAGSSNGTYVNHTPLLSGNRHRLRAGDRIALGKGDLVTFLFQVT